MKIIYFIYLQKGKYILLLLALLTNLWAASYCRMSLPKAWGEDGEQSWDLLLNFQFDKRD